MKWYVAFVPTPNRGCYRYFVGRDHPDAHCFALRPLATGGWIRVEKSALGLYVTELPDDQGQALIDLAKQVGTVLLAKRRPRSIRWIPPFWGTCTESVKSLLRINNTWLLTPRQLRCELLRTGAEQM
jgi:hypothetical protein